MWQSLPADLQRLAFDYNRKRSALRAWKRGLSKKLLRFVHLELKWRFEFGHGQLLQILQTC